MKLYMANCTDQVQVINYRLPERKNAQTQTIQIGTQVIVGTAALNVLEVEAVIKQQEEYGARSCKDFPNGREKDTLVPRIYSVDEPVPHKLMLAVIEHNKNLLISRGQKLRKEAAIAASFGMRDMAPNAADNLSMLVQEDKGGTLSDVANPFNEGVRMDPSQTYA